MTFPTLKQIEEYNNFQQRWYKRFGQFNKGQKIPNIREYFSEKRGELPLAKKRTEKRQTKT